MKLILILSALLLLFTIPAFSELTVADLEKISSIVAESEKRLKEDIAELKQELKADIAQEVGKVSVKIEERGKSLNYIFAMVIALVALIAVVVGVPQIVVAMQEKKDHRARDEKIEVIRKQVEALQREMETRK